MQSKLSGRNARAEVEASTVTDILESGLPSAPDAERSILGGIILENDLIRADATAISVDDFYLDAHRKIYRRMLDLSESGSPIDILTLAGELTAHKELESVNGIAYLSSLTDNVPRRTSIAHYCRIVREKAILRNLVYLGQSITSKAAEQGESSAAIIESAQRKCIEFALMSESGEQEMFVDVTEFCKGEERDPDWIVEGLIVRGSNGIVAADPKGAKSMTAGCGLSVSLALGMPWLGLAIPRRVRTALVTREDNPEETKYRLRRVICGKGASVNELSDWLYVNSKEQTRSLMLDNPREVNNLIRCLKRRKIEFAILDVFNKLHVQDENDNTKVRMVMNQVDRISAETGAQICILHHWNKGDMGQSITRRIRGAGAIAGFAEWIAGIEMVDEKNHVRCVKFETKAGQQPKPINYQIVDTSTGAVEFRLVTAE
jgi:hypothetical protein